MLYKILKLLSAFFFCIHLHAQLDVEAVRNLAEQKGLCREFTFLQPVENSLVSYESSIGVFTLKPVQFDEPQFDSFDFSPCYEYRRCYLVSLNKNVSLDHYNTENDYLIYNDIFELDTSWIARAGAFLECCYFSFSQDQLMIRLNCFDGEKKDLHFPKYDLLSPIKVVKDKDIFAVVIQNNTSDTLYVVPSKMLSIFDEAAPLSILPYKSAILRVHLIKRLKMEYDGSGNLCESVVGDFLAFDNYVFLYFSGLTSNDEKNIFRVALNLHNIHVKRINDGFLIDSF